MQTLTNVWSDILIAARGFRLPWDLLDILLVAYVVYKGVQLIRETRAGQLVKGILLLVAAYLIAQMAELNTVTWILNKVFELGIITLIVVFQPELRRTLEKVGRLCGRMRFGALLLRSFVKRCSGYPCRLPVH